MGGLRSPQPHILRIYRRSKFLFTLYFSEFTLYTPNLRLVIFATTSSTERQDLNLWLARSNCYSNHLSYAPKNGQSIQSSHSRVLAPCDFTPSPCRYGHGFTLLCCEKFSALLVFHFLAEAEGFEPSFSDDESDCCHWHTLTMLSSLYPLSTLIPPNDWRQSWPSTAL